MKLSSAEILYRTKVGHLTEIENEQRHVQSKAKKSLIMVHSVTKLVPINRTIKQEVGVHIIPFTHDEEFKQGGWIAPQKMQGDSPSCFAFFSRTMY